ncbi:helix-turn-helix domain-containing protein [Prevotella sp. OH937_COT-195]|nr:helix-turn-helix domain-containing protein [Prevotella sp. OH937_COT-195]
MKMNRHYSIIIIFTFFFSLATTDAGAEKKEMNGVELGNMSDTELLKHGEKLMAEGNSDSALLCFGLINKREPADKNIYAKSLHFTGKAYYTRSSYAKAMESYMESLHVCEENGINDLLPEIYKDIGNIYSMFNDYQRSSTLYAKALDLARKKGDRVFVNKLLSNLICAYTPQTPIKKYWEYYNEMCSYKEDRMRYKYDLLMDKGMILSYEKKNEEAITYFKKTLDFVNKHEMSPLSIASVYISLANTYQAMGNRDSALFYMYKNKEIAEQIKNPALMIITLRKLSEIYRNIDERKSLEYKSEYLALSDSIFNMNEFNGIRNALYYYEMDEKLKTISSLSETNRASIHEIIMQRRWLLTLAIFCVIVVFLVILAYIQNRRLSRSYRHLFHKNQEELATDKIYARRIREMKERMDRLQNNEKASDEKPLQTLVKEVGKPTSDNEEGRKVQEMPCEEPNTDETRSQTKIPEELRNSLLDSIMHVMEHGEEFCDSDFGIERLATLVGSNSKYVSQVINDVYSKNFRTFLNEFRVKKAMTRMNDTENYGKYTIKAIAESVGYKSQSNFINVFTRQTGIKPSVFQKISREKDMAAIDND